MFDVELFGINSGAHHLVNVFFHILNAIFLFLILKNLTNDFWPSALVAALFALHPLHVESVAWISERKDVLSTFFWLMSISAYIFYLKKPDWLRYCLTLFIYMLGLMSKPMLVTLPFVLLLLDYWPLGRFAIESPPEKKAAYKSEKKKSKQTPPSLPQKEMRARAPFWKMLLPLLREKIPFFILAAISSLITIQAQEKIIHSTDLFPVGDRIGNALVSYASYLWNMLWPVNLSIFYPHSIGRVSSWIALVIAIFFILITFAVLRSRLPYLKMGLLWYFGTLVPVIGLVQVGMQAMADRYTYVPLIGIFIVIAWAIRDLLNWKPSLMRITVSICCIIILVMGILTWKQVSYWKNSITLYEHAAAAIPDNYWAHYNLGFCLMNAGNPEGAFIHLQESLRIKPQSIEALNNMGVLRGRRGDAEGAIADFSKALEIWPDSFQTRINLGYILLKTGKLDESLHQYREALRIAPGNPNAHQGYGAALSGAGKLEEALAEFNKALRLEPGNAKTHNSIGIVMARKGDIPNAIYHFQKAVSINPDFSEASRNLKVALDQIKQ